MLQLSVCVCVGVHMCVCEKVDCKCGYVWVFLSGGLYVM